VGLTTASLARLESDAALRLPRRSSAANGEAAPETEPAKLDTEGQATAFASDPVAGRGTSTTDRRTRPGGHPTAPDTEGVTAFEGPGWQERFGTVEELWEAFQNVDTLRGRLANELGQLRRQVGLYSRMINLLARTSDPLERFALVHAARLLYEPKAHASIEQMLAIGEAHYEETRAVAL
jgi:hypothetical protein